MQFKEDPIVVSSREDRTRKLKIRDPRISQQQVPEITWPPIYGGHPSFLLIKLLPC